MNLAEVKQLLDKSGMPVAYHHFNNAMTAPFVVYYVPDIDYIGADDAPYISMATLRIELYTDIKDVTAEHIIEDLLLAAGIFYSKSEVWISDEKLYEIVYESEVIE